MKTSLSKYRFPALGFCLLMAVTLTVSVRGAALDTAKIEQITGLKGAFNQAEQVFKVSSPRTNIKVSVDNWTMPPFMGLTSWAAFSQGESDDLIVMGDLVLLQDEVNPVLSAALENGLEVTALHNHFFFDEPRVYFMHIGGEGSLAQLATGVRKALDTVKAVRTARPKPAKGFAGGGIPAKNDIGAKRLDAVFNTHGQSKDGMYKAVFGRKAKMDCGCNVGTEMGVNTWAAFAGTDDNAVVDGDFAVHEKELQDILKTLRKAGINIVAIHQHMIGETPRTLFLHYWGRGKAEDLAAGIKAALNTLK